MQIFHCCKTYTVYTVNMMFFLYDHKLCSQCNFSFFIFLAWGPHQSGQWDEHLHHSQRVSGIANCKNKIIQVSKEDFSDWVFVALDRPTLKAWIKTLSLPQSKLLAAVLPTLERWGTHVWTAWCSCCPTAMVSLSVQYSRCSCLILHTNANILYIQQAE